MEISIVHVTVDARWIRPHPATMLHGSPMFASTTFYLGGLKMSPSLTIHLEMLGQVPEARLSQNKDNTVIYMTNIVTITKKYNYTCPCKHVSGIDQA